MSLCQLQRKLPPSSLGVTFGSIKQPLIENSSDFEQSLYSPFAAPPTVAGSWFFTGWYLLAPWRIAASTLFCYWWWGVEDFISGAWVLPDSAACQTDPNKTVCLFCGHRLCSGCAASDCSALVALSLAVWYSWGIALQLLLGALWHRHRLISWHWHCSLWNQIGRRVEKKNIIREKGKEGDWRRGERWRGGY